MKQVKKKKSTPKNKKSTISDTDFTLKIAKNPVKKSKTTAKSPKSKRKGKGKGKSKTPISHNIVISPLTMAHNISDE